MPSTAPAETLRGQVARLTSERDEYKRLYLSVLEICRRLEQGLLGQKRERFLAGDAQAVLPEVLKLLVPAAVPAEPKTTEVPGHTRAKPTGRHPPPEELPRVTVETLPPEVQRLGLDAFERIGEDRSEVVERRTASWVVVETIRPKLVPKSPSVESPIAVEPPVPQTPSSPESALPAAAPAPMDSSSQVAATSSPGQPVSPDRSLAAGGAPGRILQAPAPELPIARGMAGPALLAETIVRRWQDSLPLNRLEQIYAREGLPLAKSTIGNWHAELAQLVRPLVAAMWKDALEHSPYLCVDATGVLVLQKEKCRRGHFFVVVAPERHVLFAYTPEHTQKAVSQILDGYRGYLVLDAHTVYEHLFRDGATECGCWSHYLEPAAIQGSPRDSDGCRG